jgi:hypothetical protein
MSSGNDFLNLALKWKGQLLLIFGISFLLSIIFSGKMFIKPLYRSTAIIYPINTFSYSEESATEQMLQLFNSKDLHYAVIDSLDLFTHYDIKKDEIFAEEKVLKKFQKRISIQRTEYESVKINAFDRRPEMSFQMVSFLLKSYNEYALQLMRKKAAEVLVIKETIYREKKHEVDSIKHYVDSLIRESNLSEYHILRESMRGNYQFINASPGNAHSLNKFSEKTLELFYAQRVLESELAILITLKNHYENALSDVNKELIFIDIVSLPDIPQKTAYPVRLFLILISVATTLFFAFCIILLIERKQKGTSQ